MKKIRPFLLGFLFCMFLIKSFAQQDERIHAAYMLAFGRDASPLELNYWMGRGNFSIGKLIEFHRQGFVEYPNLHSETINRAYMDALGRKPSENEMKYWMNGIDIYIEMINTQLKFLKFNWGEYERILRASYISVFNREPNITEINFWKKKDVIPFFMLASYHKKSQKDNNSEARSYEEVNLRNLPSVSIFVLSTDLAAETSNIIDIRGSSVIRHLDKQSGKIVIVTGNINVEFN